MPRFTRTWSLIFLLSCFGIPSAVADSSPVTNTYSETNLFSNSMNGPMGSMAGAMNVSSPISSGIRFYFTYVFSETVTVWSSANGTGTLLATLAISPAHLSCVAFPSYCSWRSVGVAIGSGTGKSISFGNSAAGLGIADLSFNSDASAIPEPSPIYLVAAGLAAASFGGLRRFFHN